MANVNEKKQITGLFVYITGFSGSGKLSTAMELSSMIDALVVNSNAQVCSLFDNVFECNQIPKEVQDRIYNIMQIMLQVIEIYPIHSKNYIFVDELMKDNSYNVGVYDSIVRLSEKMGTKVLPVVLKCDLPTLQKRIALKRQRGNMKAASTNSIVGEFRDSNLFIPPGAMEIENSNMSIREVAEKIVNQAHELLPLIHSVIFG